MKLTTETYGAYINTNNSWWRATLTAEKLNEKLHGKKEVEKIPHKNPAIQAIHDNKNLTRDEKITLAKAIINGEKAKPKNETKSKVCIIANRLIKKGLSRSAAFCKAWQTVKAETLNIKVAGVTFGNRQTALEHLKKYAADNISINLERDTANEHDTNAVAVIATVKDKGSYKIGYIPQKLSATIAPLIDYGKSVKAQFKEVIGKYQSYHNYGLSVNLSI